MNSILTTVCLAALTLSTSSISFAAGKCCNTPTIWTFKNAAKLPVKLSCVLESSTANPIAPVTVATDTVAPGASFEHNWGPNWDNDGMGLIPGHWTCKNTEAKGGNTASIKFDTDWGENVVVTWKDSEPTVAKAEAPKYIKLPKAKN